eukprot:6487516-Amphidinium_carterae.1
MLGLFAGNSPRDVRELPCQGCAFHTVSGLSKPVCSNKLFGFNQVAEQPNTHPCFNLVCYSSEKARVCSLTHERNVSGGEAQSRKVCRQALRNTVFTFMIRHGATHCCNMVLGDLWSARNYFVRVMCIAISMQLGQPLGMGFTKSMVDENISTDFGQSYLQATLLTPSHRNLDT